MAEQVPSIGRVVHFVYGDVHVPAIITDPSFRVVTDVYDQIEQALVVFPVGLSSFSTVATYSADPLPGTWHWPEYVPAKG